MVLLNLVKIMKTQKFRTQESYAIIQMYMCQTAILFSNNNQNLLFKHIIQKIYKMFNWNN